ncbi:N-acetylglucosamine-6-phosphate deacetylase [Sphingomonas sp. URHD0057]|uniref:N-acetylglucosamine-6-phosphate deacetylase n=1 Tax=Sphingomonas sp. URHD0057 TaxID=1380389 RepID=UPI00048A79E1|nr:N-acetylglucosamine-6-phosphate deacetylase [Sphingomonas sp. URHD0057]
MIALCPSRILTPVGFETERCLLIEDGRIVDVVPECPPNVSRENLEGELVPGFIDLQVNGGGGVLFNDQPTIEGIEAIGRSHRAFGTTGFLPTLITTDLEVLDRAMRAVEGAIARGVPGVLGIHIEGPFINSEKRGIHDSTKIRQIDDTAVELLASLSNGVTLVTLAPELAPAGVIAALAARGVVVAAGHTAASYEQTRQALDDGVTGFTHLFNAMSQLIARAPGAVGAALDSDAWCSLIIDGFHVHPASLRIALAAKGSDQLVLVTDAMATVGSAETTFMLGDRPIHVDDGRLAADDGTLAGSNLDMATAVVNAAEALQVDLATAIRMASLNPARAVGLEQTTGAISPGLRADLALLNPDGRVARTWISGIASD